jgi:hypothetical protein
MIYILRQFKHEPTLAPISASAIPSHLRTVDVYDGWNCGDIS